jgi:4,5-dihydroxyphthalate decarboxylase
MADIALKTVTGTQGATRALKDGDVTPRRFAFEFEEVPGLIPAFRRMVRGLEFDVCEMAFTTYLCAKAFGKPFTALPIFLVRAFHHGAIVRGGASAARTPKDLEGRQVGVNRGYTVTTGVWARGILQDEYGVDLSRITWVLSGDEHVAEYRPPANVVPLAPGGDLAEQVRAGDLAAGIGLNADRPGHLAAGSGADRPSRLETLIPAAEEAGFDALRSHGLYPINHLVVIKDDLLAAHPGLAADVFWAFAEAKRRYVDRLTREEADPQDQTTDQMYRRVMAITGHDPLPYGIEPNRAMIELLIRHAVSQRILNAPAPAVETLFAEGTRDLAA